MKRLMIITAVFALLLTGCGTRVNHDTLIELSVNSITEYQNRLNAIHPKDLQVSINELAQKEGLETRVATSEYSGKEYQYSRAYLDDGTEYSISATDHGDFFWVLITISNSKDNTIPRKMCERIRSLAFERGLTLSRNRLSDKITGGNLVVNDMLKARKVVGVKSKSARTGRKTRLEKLIDGRNNVLYQSRDDE